MSLLRRLLPSLICALTPPSAATAAADTTAPGPDDTFLEVRVGSDAACDYLSIAQAALFAPAADLLRIRIARNVVLSGPQLIPGRNLILQGGYDSCADPSPSGRSVLDGSGFSGSLLVAAASFGAGASYSLRLIDLELTGGDSTSAAFPAGALDVEGPFQVYLQNTWVHANRTSRDGGGINLRGPAGAPDSSPLTQLYVLLDARIEDNQADGAGGGIACSGQARVTIVDATVSGNRAGTQGGGLQLDRCDGRVFAIDRTTLFSANSAGSGTVGLGGAVAVSGASFFASGGQRAAVIFLLNSAANGGAVHVNGFSNPASAAFNDTWLESNSARYSGGAIAASYANVVVQRTRPGVTCHDSLYCSRLRGNRAYGTTPTSGGGALFAFSGTTSISGSWLLDNRADSGRGSALWVRDAAGTRSGLDVNGMRLLGSVVARQRSGAPSIGDNDAVVALQDSSGAIGFVTFADNADFRQVVSTHNVGSDAYPVVVYGTIFAEATGSGLSVSPGDNGVIPNGDCNSLFETASPFATRSERSLVGGVTFQGSGDYRLAVQSDVIDWCDASESFPFVMSADGGPRPYDDPAWLPLYGNYDLGGLERHPDDRIFANGFDAG